MNGTPKHCNFRKLQMQMGKLLAGLATMSRKPLLQFAFFAFCMLQ